MICPVGLALAVGGALASLCADHVVGFLLERPFSISSMVWRTRFPKLLFVLFSFSVTIGPGMPPCMLLINLAGDAEYAEAMKFRSRSHCPELYQPAV